MKRSLPRLDLTIAILSVLWLLALLLVPPERTLGVIVRWVFAHASLTQVSLLFFLVAGLLAIAYLLGGDKFYVWMQTTGWVALGLWVVGFLLSTIPAKMSWGVWVDFNEPRTQMTLRVLAVGLVFIVLTKWVDHPRFTAIAQIVLSALILFLNRSIGVIRHPLNPIGQSDNPAMPLAYSLLFLLSLLISALIVIDLVQHRKRQAPAVAEAGS